MAVINSKDTIVAGTLSNLLRDIKAEFARRNPVKDNISINLTGLLEQANKITVNTSIDAKSNLIDWIANYEDIFTTLFTVCNGSASGIPREKEPLTAKFISNSYTALESLQRDAANATSSSCHGACQGLCYGTCFSECSGCTGGASSTAGTSNKGDGESEGSSSCVSMCGSCSQSCSGPSTCNCSYSCYGGCAGGCGGSCSSCYGCSGKCQSSCLGCTGNCTGTCSTECTGCYASCSSGCGANCTGLSNK